jgi:hypothetical protein
MYHQLLPNPNPTRNPSLAQIVTLSPNLKPKPYALTRSPNLTPNLTLSPNRNPKPNANPNLTLTPNQSHNPTLTQP